MSKLIIKLNSSDSTGDVRKLMAFGPNQDLSGFLSNLGQVAQADCKVQLLNEDAAYASVAITMDFANQTAGDTIQIGVISLEADTDFAIGASDAESATNLSAAINLASSGRLQATSAGAVVTVTSSIAGPLGNEIPVIKDQAAAGMASADALSGGSDDTAASMNYKHFK
jgi:phage tail sheath gpL-like